VDVVASYRNIGLGAAALSINLAGNYRLKNELVGGWQAVNNKIGLPIYNQTSEALLTTSRPKYKFILGGDLTTGKLTFNLNNTLFGATQFNNADLSSDLQVEFLPKVLTDLGATYSINSKTTFSLTIQNILNVMPEYKLKAMNADGQLILNDESQVAEQISYITFNGRYPVLTYDGSHFSQMGSTYLAQLTFKF
jgi:iron complex outermembrane receptor protein